MNLTNEQIQAILDSCKRLHTNDADEIDEFIEGCFDFGGLQGLFSEILTLRQEVERLKAERDSVCHLNDSLSAELSHLCQEVERLKAQQSEVAARAVEDAVMNTPTHKMKADERLYHSQRALLGYANQLREQDDE